MQFGKCLIISDGKLVLVKNKKWLLPGGEVGDEQDPEEVAVAIAREQLGIPLEVIQQFDIYEEQVDGQNIITTVFECNPQGALVESATIKKFSKEEMPDDISNTVQSVIDAL